MQFIRFLRQWFWLGAVIFGLGGWVAKLQADLNDKAPAASVTDMQKSLVEIKAKLDEIAVRQQQFFCKDQPTWCR